MEKSSGNFCQRDESRWQGEAGTCALLNPDVAIDQAAI